MLINKFHIVSTLRYIAFPPKNLLAMKDKTNVVSAIAGLISWLLMLILEDIYIVSSAFWQGFYIDNKFTYSVFLLVIIFCCLNTCR